MTSRFTVLGVLAGMLAAIPAAAQKQGSLEIGGFARFTEYDNSLPVSSALGVGGRVAVHALPRLALEIDVSRSSSDGVKHSPFHVWVVYDVPADARADILVGGGYVHNSYSDAYDASDGGIGGFVGVRYRFGETLALRIDASEDFVWNPANSSHQSAFNGNWGVSAGVSVLLNWAGRTQ